MSNLENDLTSQGDELVEEEAVEMPAAGSVDTLRILEAVLFASDEICTAARLKTILPGTPDGREIGKMIDQINRQLQKERHPFEIVELGGGYQFKTIAYYHPWVRQIFKEKAAKRLSIQALECLSIIAYRQPLSKAEIEAIRGVISDGAMKTLLEKRLVTIVGRSEKVGRPLLYGTTAEFLKYFGLNKIADLPKIEEFEALAREKFDQLPLEQLKNAQEQVKSEAADEASIEIAMPDTAPAEKNETAAEAAMEPTDPAEMPTQRMEVVKEEASIEISASAAAEVAAPPPSIAAAEEPEAEVFDLAATKPAAAAEPIQPAAEKPAKSKKRQEPRDEAIPDAGLFEIAPAAAPESAPAQESPAPEKKAPRSKKHKEPETAAVPEEADVIEVNIKEEKPKQEEPKNGDDDSVFEVKL